MFQEPYRGADHELDETLERGRRRAGPPASPATPRTVGITLLWIGILFGIGFALLNLGIIDPAFCHGTMNPASC